MIIELFSDIGESYLFTINKQYKLIHRLLNEILRTSWVSILQGYC